MMSQRTMELLDEAERLRLRGQVAAALASVDEVLKTSPHAGRALLLKSRLFYQSGSVRQALESLGALEASTPQRELAPLTRLLQQLDYDSRKPPPFATESMARLLVQQGYLLEAMEVYRQIFDGALNRDELRDEIVRLKDTIQRDGSRDAGAERVQRELEVCERWLEEHPRGV